MNETTDIRETVALEDVLAAVTAGFEAVLAEQRKITELLVGLQPDDAAIGEITEHYNAKMAVIKGGI